MEKYREQTTLRLPPELKEKLQTEAERMGMPFNAYLLLIIREYLERRK